MSVQQLEKQYTDWMEDIRKRLFAVIPKSLITNYGDNIDNDKQAMETFSNHMPKKKNGNKLWQDI